MDITPGRNEIYMRRKTYVSLDMDSHTMNVLRSFIGEALEEGIWEQDDEYRKLIRELHDCMYVNRVFNKSDRVHPKSQWGETMERQLSEHREEAEGVWRDLDNNA